MGTGIDFGYPWWLGSGHLVLLLVLAGLWQWKRRPGWTSWVLGALILWAGAAFYVARFVIDVNGRGALPTEKFMAAGKGRVVDIGAGTGRSTLQVLEARPGITVVATDLFGSSFEGHFGKQSMSGEERLMANMRAAGVASRVSVVKADMRELPFGDGEFDGAVSAFAIDHLNGEGIRKAMGEAGRVVKPEGEFLLMLVGLDPWVKFAFGPLLVHSRSRDMDWWGLRMGEAGFAVEEKGMKPAMMYFWGRKK